MLGAKNLFAILLIGTFFIHTANSQTAAELQLLSEVGVAKKEYYDQSKGNSADWMGGKNIVSTVVGLPLSGLMLLYQNVLSPQLASSCQYALSCSNFSKAAFREYGIVKGFGLTLDRLYRCNGSTHDHYGRLYRDEEGLLEESICDHY